MNTNKKTDGTIQGLREFYERDFQEYKPNKTFAPFYQHKFSEYSCGNPIIIGFVKTGKLAWMEQWIEVSKCEDNGKYGWGCSTCSDTCEGHNKGPAARHAFFHLPHPNYAQFYSYDSAEDAVRAAIEYIGKLLDERGDGDNKGTRKMLGLAREQLYAPTEIQLSLF